MSEPSVDERTTVEPIPEARAPAAWHKTLRLIKWLREIFPDSVIDVPELEVKETRQDA